MIEDMREMLAGLSAKLERRRKIDIMLQSLFSEEQELARREMDLKTILTKEKVDVRRLERTTATSVLYSFLGKLDIKLNEEQQEATVAKLKYDAAVRQLDDCRMRLDELNRERDTLSDCAEQYNQVFADLKEQLQLDPVYAERLCALERRRGETESQLRELDEAIWAGNNAMNQIDRIEDNLGNAAGWGTFDMLGGGFISDMAKHTSLDAAQEDAEQLQILLSRFRTELADVHISAEMTALNIDGFLRFADYFFDGLFADWAVQNRIHDSQDSVYQVKQQVGGALSKLSSLRSARAAEKEVVEQQIAILVTKE